MTSHFATQYKNFSDARTSWARVLDQIGLTKKAFGSKSKFPCAIRDSERPRVGLTDLVEYGAPCWFPLFFGLGLFYCRRQRKMLISFEQNNTTCQNTRTVGLTISDHCFFFLVRFPCPYRQDSLSWRFGTHLLARPGLQEDSEARITSIIFSQREHYQVPRRYSNFWKLKKRCY